MKWQAMFVVFVLSAVMPSAIAQDVVKETKARGYWTDPSTGLTWAGKDNGKDVTWNKAVKYCLDLKMAGFSDWRLATIGELAGIYDQSAKAPGLAGRHGDVPVMWHVKGGLSLTGHQWSSSEKEGSAGYAWRFDFNEGRQFGGDEVSFSAFKRALCVRGSSTL